MAMEPLLTVSLGSTVPYVVERIVQQGESVNKGRVFIPTGTSLFHTQLSTVLNIPRFSIETINCRG
jgi:hypothetical protein